MRASGPSRPPPPPPPRRRYGPHRGLGGGARSLGGRGRRGCAPGFLFLGLALRLGLGALALLLLGAQALLFLGGPLGLRLAAARLLSGRKDGDLFLLAALGLTPR